MRLKAVLAAALLGFGLAPAPVAAQAAIKVDQQKDFKHRPSGIVLGSTAAGLQRVSLVQYDDKQLDVAADFRTLDDREVTTVYIFRKVTGDVPLWFDRIQHVIEAKTTLSSPQIAIPASAFTPAGQSNARGLRAVYSAGAAPWKSSAAALTMTGDWYVAVRASSQSLTPDQLLARVEQTFAAIRWPKEKAAAPAATPVGLCSTALAQAPEDAQPVSDAGATLLASALSATVESSIKSAVAAPPIHWCRDPTILPNAGVFRPDGANDRYLIAFQDAGRGIWVAPNGLAGILMGAKGGGEPSFMVELIEIDRHVGYGSFKTLPNISQAMWTIEHGNQQYVSPTWGKDRTIQISSDSLKN